MARIAEAEGSTTSSGSGNVTGIPPTTETAIAIWANTSGTEIENSIPTVQAGGTIEASGFLTDRSVTTLIQIPAQYSWIAPEVEIELTGAIEIEADGEMIII
jgi:hypothetical protein